MIHSARIFFATARFDDVGIGETARWREPDSIDVPEGGEFRAVVGVFELAVAGQAGSEAGFARAHRVALAGDGEGRGAGAADVAGEQGQIADGVHGLGALGAVIHAHGPADEAGFGAAVEERGLVERLFAEPGDAGDAFRSVVRRGMRASSSKPGGVLCDVVAIDQVVPDQDVRDAVQQRQIGARLERQMEVGHHRGLGDARIGDDQRLVGVGCRGTGRGSGGCRRCWRRSAG